MAKRQETYDVALSYAGEQREYVGRVAEILQAEGVNVFFDDFEREDLWGHDLAVHFDEVFRTKARFVAPFVSKEYAAKAWPQHEFKSALAKAVEVNEPYILPVRFDQTPMPGLRPTIKYLDGTKLSPEEVAATILKRLGRHGDAPPPSPPTRSTRLPSVPPANFNPYAEAERAVAHLREELNRRARELEAQGFGVHAQVRGERFMLRVMRAGETVYGLDVWIGGGFGENTICFAIGTSISQSPNSTNGTATVEWDRERGRPIIKLFNMSILREMGREYRLTAEELVDEIWEALCQELERRT